MIYTVTLNPSLDYFMQVDSFIPGRVNRTRSEEIFPGGKGINVSLVLKSLGIESRMAGFKAGFTGDALEKLLASMDCVCDFVPAEGLTRINVKIKGASDTELNARGPEITGTALEAFLKKLDGLQDGDTLVLAGSIPQSVPLNTYERLLKRQEGKDLNLVVDAENDLLLSVLKYRPFLIKPNHHELGKLFGTELKNMEEMRLYAGKLQMMGARNVLVSMAEKGALLLAEDGQFIFSAVPEGRFVSAVGSGDSMVAGFLAGWLRYGNYKHAFDLGLAAGSATAYCEGLADGQAIWRLHGTMVRNG